MARTSVDMEKWNSIKQILSTEGNNSSPKIQQFTIASLRLQFKKLNQAVIIQMSKKKIGAIYQSEDDKIALQVLRNYYMQPLCSKTELYKKYQGSTIARKKLRKTIPEEVQFKLKLLGHLLKADQVSLLPKTVFTIEKKTVEEEFDELLSMQYFKKTKVDLNKVTKNEVTNTTENQKKQKLLLESRRQRIINQIKELQEELSQLNDI